MFAAVTKDIEIKDDSERSVKTLNVKTIVRK